MTAMTGKRTRVQGLPWTAIERAVDNYPGPAWMQLHYVLEDGTRCSLAYFNDEALAQGFGGDD